MESISTKDKLKKIGKEEFLAHGYKDASLRAIGKKAGFTLGAFYGYYSGKEDLFDDIVAECAQSLIEKFEKVQMDFARLPPEEQTVELELRSGSGTRELIERIYENYDEYKLLFFRAAGTRYEGYLQCFIDIEIQSTKSFIGILRGQGYSTRVDEEIIRILASSMFSGLTEIIAQDMSIEKAYKYMEELRGFYSAGWKHLLGMRGV